MSTLNISSDKEYSPSTIYDYQINGNWFTRLLYFSAGVDQQLLKHCPNYDRVKLQGIGGTVLATAVLAFISGSYALYTVFAPESPFHPNDINYAWALGSLLFGIVWALIIFNLDRFIVSSSGSGDGTEGITGGEILKSLPRFAMACLIGFVISKPLEIRVMKSEIDAQLQVEQTANTKEKQKGLEIDWQKTDSELNKVKQDLVLQKTNLLKELEKYKQDFDQAEIEYRKEIDAGGGNRAGGVGKVAEAKLKVVEQRKSELVIQTERIQPEIDSFNSRIKKKEEEIDQTRKIYLRNYDEAPNQSELHNGLIKKIQIAHEISPYASGFLTAMLIFVEISPLLFKMMLKFSVYDYLLENQKRISITRRGIKSSYIYLNENEESLQISNATYYENDLEETRVIGKLKIDRELHDKVQSQFAKYASDDIEKNPNAYIDRIQQ